MAVLLTEDADLVRSALAFRMIRMKGTSMLLPAATDRRKARHDVKLHLCWLTCSGFNWVMWTLTKSYRPTSYVQCSFLEDHHYQKHGSRWCSSGWGGFLEWTCMLRCMVAWCMQVTQALSLYTARVHAGHLTMMVMAC